MSSYDPRANGARCDICPLARGGIPQHPVVPPSPARAPLRLVVAGEGPGRAEEKLRQPFVGASGQFLNERLRKDVDQPREACHITNAALCRGESDRDNERAAECCAPRLLNELAGLPAEVPIAALGKAATKSILSVGNILRSRGFVWRAPEIPDARIRVAKKDPLRKMILEGRAQLAGRMVLPTLHPAFVLRADTWKPISQLDFRRIGRAARGELSRLHDDVEYVTTTDVERLSILGLVVSCDIETDGIDVHTCNILSVGLSDGKNGVQLWPWNDRMSKALAAFLATREQVVFHNGHNFDLIVLERHGCAW